MSVPLATTTVTVREVPADPNRDPYDAAPAAVTVASGVRAHISTSSGREQVAGGSQEVVTFRLSCDPFDGGLSHQATVEDEQTGEVYEVVWSVARFGIGLDHIQAGLRQVSGVA